jgi:hypothetical protein
MFSKIVHPHIGLVFSENFLTCIFLGVGVGRDEPIPCPLSSPDITSLQFFLWGYVKGIIYKTPVTSLDELKFRIVAAIETVTPQMLENAWREIEYRLDNLRAMKRAHVEVFFSISIDSLGIKILLVALSYSVSSYFFFGLKIIGHGNPDNSLESFCISIS